jgi:hypothetical protein
MNELDPSRSRSAWHALARRVLPDEPAWQAAEGERGRRLHAAAGDAPLLGPDDLAPHPRRVHRRDSIRRRQAARHHRAPHRLLRARRR